MLNRSIGVLTTRWTRFMSLSTVRSQFFGNKVDLEITNRAGEVFNVKARVGDSILDTVMDNDVEWEGYGICGGGIACSTCHVIFEESTFEISIENDPWSDEECDMLDNAINNTETSRLGCCVKVKKNLEGAKISIPLSSDAR